MWWVFLYRFFLVTYDPPFHPTFCSTSTVMIFTQTCRLERGGCATLHRPDKPLTSQHTATSLACWTVVRRYAKVHCLFDFFIHSLLEPSPKTSSRANISNSYKKVFSIMMCGVVPIRSLSNHRSDHSPGLVVVDATREGGSWSPLNVSSNRLLSMLIRIQNVKEKISSNVHEQKIQYG